MWQRLVEQPLYVLAKEMHKKLGYDSHRRTFVGGNHIQNDASTERL